MEENSALLVVSFGTSYKETRKQTIEAIEQDLTAAFPRRKFYRAWTSERIRKKLRETEGICYDNVRDAMERMLEDGITDVLIQTTYMMPGAEFEAAKDTVVSYRGRFEKLSMGTPLLAGEEDLGDLANAIEETFESVKSSELLVLMGHGSAHSGFPAYSLLDEKLKQDGFGHFCVGTVEFEPGIEPVLWRTRERKPEKVYLTPLLVVAGDHAIHDMAGEDPDSWRSQLEREGAETVCIVRGMGEYQKIRDIYVKHAQNASPV